MNELSEALADYWKGIKALKKTPDDQVIDREVLNLKWKHIRDIGNTIPCKWLDPLVEGEAAEAEYEIDGVKHGLLVEPEVPMLGGARKRRLREYQAHVEKIALWRWHSARGTPVNDLDQYAREPGFKEPTFEWEGVEAKRGPGRPAKSA